MTLLYTNSNGVISKFQEPIRKFNNKKEVYVPQVSVTKVKGEDLNGLWNSEDHDKILYRFAKRIQFLKSLSKFGTRDERVKIVLEFNQKMEKCYNDHRNVLIREITQPSTFFNPQRVELHDNLVVQSGLSKIADTMANLTNTFFTFIGVGEDSSALGLLNTNLRAPVYRVNVQNRGWFEAHGNSLFSGSVFPEDMQTMFIREIGGFDRPTDPAVLFWRIVITEIAKQFKHVIGETFATISHKHDFT